MPQLIVFRVLQSLGTGTGTGGAQPGTVALAHLSGTAKDAYRHAATTGPHQIFRTAAFVCAAVLLAALCIKEVPLRGSPVQTDAPRGTASSATR